jgi:hypothetical protein
MTPIEEIIPGLKLLEDELVIYAKDQPEYIPLPMWNGPAGLRLSRWKLTWKERLQILIGGSIWLQVLTFDRPLQPVRMHTNMPLGLKDWVLSYRNERLK